MLYVKLPAALKLFRVLFAATFYVCSLTTFRSTVHGQRAGTALLQGLQHGLEPTLCNSVVLFCEFSPPQPFAVVFLYALNRVLGELRRATGKFGHYIRLYHPPSGSHHTTSLAVRLARSKPAYCEECGVVSLAVQESEKEMIKPAAF